MAELLIGPSRLGIAFGTNWNNESWGSDGPILCEVCGKQHPERKDKSYTVSRFLGRQVVEECCGAILDSVYKESGEEFTIAFLIEFANDPCDPRFLILVLMLEKCLKNADKKLKMILGQVQNSQESLTAISAVFP